MVRSVTSAASSSVLRGSLVGGDGLGQTRPKKGCFVAFPSPLLAGQPAAAKGEREREPFLLKCLTPKEKSQTDRQDLFFFPSQPPSARNTRQTGYNWIGPKGKKPKQI